MLASIAHQVLFVISKDRMGCVSLFCIEELIFDPVIGIPLDSRARFRVSGRNSWRDIVGPRAAPFRMCTGGFPGEKTMLLTPLQQSSA